MTSRLNVKLSVVAAAVSALFAGPAQSAPVLWVPTANGNWDIAANWNPGLPDVNDDVTIDVAGARVVTVRSTGGPFAINSLIVGGDDALTISGGSLTINGLPSSDNATGASILAQLTQNAGGILGGTGLVTVTGAASLTGNSIHTGPGTTVLQGATALSGLHLDAGRVLRNEGTATLTGGMNLNITDAAGTGRIENAAGAVFDVRTFNLSLTASNFAGDSGTSAVIDNAGIFRKSTGGTYSVGVSFNNLATGTIDLVLGGFSFSAGGSYNGAVTMATGTTLTWSGGTHTVHSGATFTGDGTLAASGAVIQLDAATTVNSRFSHSSGSLQGADLTLNGISTLTGATHAGTGTTTTKGASTWSGFTLDAGRVLRNEGNAAVTGGLNLNATNAPDAGRVENAQGAVIDVQTFNLSMFASNFAGDTGADAGIGNAGIFRKSTNGGYTVSVPFANLATGTIDVQAGSFNFTGGGTYSGAVTLASAGTLTFGGGTHAVGAGASFQGPGTLTLIGAGTVLDLLAPTTVNSAFTMNSGTVRGANLTLGGVTTLAMSSFGVMSGNATTTLTGTSSVGGGANNPFGLDAGRVLRNEGSMTITGVLNLNRLDTPGAGRIENAAGKLINVTTFNQSIVASSFTGDTGADALVSNAGIFRMSGSGGYTVAVPFLNLATGTIDVQNGSFNFTAGGTYNGAVVLANNTALGFGGGTHNVGSGATFSGPGTLTLAGAGTVLNLLAPTTIDSRFSMTGGTIGGANLVLNGPYALTISSSLGVLAGPTTTTLQGSGTVSGGPNNTFGLDAGHVLRNQGTMTITGVLDLNRLSTTGSGRIDNASGALIDVRTFNQSIFATNWVATNPLDSGGDARVNNAGTFRKSTSGTYSVFVPFFNTGVVEVLAGGLNIPSFSNGGTVNVAAGATFTVSGSSFVNTGLIQGGGTVITPTGGMTNAGTIGPGNSPGHLTIDGDLIMATDGVVSIELNGVADFDLLTVIGDATLGGELDVVRLAGYTPTIGDSFIIMTFNDRHATTFGRVNFLGFGSGVEFNVTYREQDVLLGVAAVPEPETWAMLLGGLGLVGLVAGRRRERQLAVT